MEKNTTKYFLGAAVFAIWGLLLYRVYNKMRPQNDWRPIPQEVAFSQSQNELDSFTLSLDYKNPFNVGKVRTAPRVMLADNAASKTVSNKLSKKKKEKPKPIPFPKVNYKGNISLKNGRTVALVKIENQMMNMEKGEEFEKVLLRKIYSDSIQVRFEGRDSVILKAK